jgi:ATP/maltotriose-dependent transcriptional regulator MalT
LPIQLTPLIGREQEIALYLEQLAEEVSAQAELVWSARLWGAAESLRIEFVSPLPSSYRPDYERAIATVRTRLGKQAFDTAWAEGRSMALEQVLAEPGRAEVSPQAIADHPSANIENPSPGYPDGLTAREVEVLSPVAQGLSNAEIAERFIISLLTVKSHMRSLYNKLGISSRSSATRYAIEHHLI